MANVDEILRTVLSICPQYWKLDGFATDTPPRVFVTPVIDHYVKSAPYHLHCVLRKEDMSVQTLIKAADYKNARISQDEIETIARNIVAMLDDWSHCTDLRSLLTDLPMGSTFFLDEGIGEGRSIWLSPNYELQGRYLGISRLKDHWGSLVLPPSIDLEKLQSISRLHDSVSLVLLPNGEPAIFKGAIKIIARMYHELRELLSMPEHPNIINPPRYLVTRKVKGLTEPAVCGFILDYHPGGTMFKTLTTCSQDKGLPLTTKVKWTRQLLSAMLHIYGPGKSFYSDLNLENIVISAQGDIILVDFEQFGTKQRWLDPKLWRANRLPPIPRSADWAESPVNPACMPRSIFYSNPQKGYWKPFINATEREREEYATYSIAKVIWCIFEEATNEFGIEDLSREDFQARTDDGTPLLYTVFPHFKKMPARLKFWIWFCTRQSPEWGNASCKCSGEMSQVCGDSGARFHGDSFRDRAAPSILNTHHYFEAWAAET